MFLNGEMERYACLDDGMERVLAIHEDLVAVEHCKGERGSHSKGTTTDDVGKTLDMVRTHSALLVKEMIGEPLSSEPRGYEHVMLGDVWFHS